MKKIRIEDRGEFLHLHHGGEYVGVCVISGPLLAWRLRRAVGAYLKKINAIESVEKEFNAMLEAREK